VTTIDAGWFEAAAILDHEQVRIHDSTTRSRRTGCAIPGLPRSNAIRLEDASRPPGRTSLDPATSVIAAGYDDS